MREEYNSALNVTLNSSRLVIILIVAIYAKVRSR